MGKRKRANQPDSPSWWWERAPLPSMAWILAITLAISLRLPLLDTKPAHFDEGVNGWFIDRMEESQVYNYDHKNYHGPLHFYLTLPFVATLGHHEVALRLPTVLFSLATLLVLLSFSTVIGRLPSLVSSVFFATSPGSVFFARYGIHEAGLCFFVALFALSCAKLFQTGLPKWLGLCFVALAGGALTKETFFINMATLPLAVLTIYVLSKWDPWRITPPLPPPHRPQWTWYFFWPVALLSLLAVEIIYNGFGFTGKSGIMEFAKSYSVWAETGSGGSGHSKPLYDLLGGAFNYYWFSMSAQYEWPFLVSLLASLFYWRGMSSAGRVAVTWATGTMVAYSLIPYKTPWCILSMLPSMSLAIGAALPLPFRMLKNPVQQALWPLLIAISPLPYSVILNYRDYDDPSERYVYVQTSREAKEFLEELKSAAGIDPRSLDLRGVVALDSYYPLPWWLWNHAKVEYVGENSISPIPGRYWALVSWRKSSEFLEKNRDRRWRSFTFKLREAQDEVVAFLDTDVYPKKGVFNYPSPEPAP